MGAGYHGGFGATAGSESKYKESKPKYTETPALRNHIEKADISGSGKAGIKGGHKKDNFLQAVSDVGAKITGREANSQMDGVEKISYKMPKKDRQGKPTSEFQSSTKTKTVYDSSKISTDQYIKQGLQAANNAAKSSASGELGHEWSGTDNKGIRWHGYCDDSGNITSFYPED